MVKVQVNSQGKAYITSNGKVLLANEGGSTPTLITKTIIENGIYSASSDNADGYSSVTVNVSSSSPVIETLNVTPSTSAQTITAPSGTDGYSPVNIAAVTAAIDNNIVAGNIVSGVSILGVAGSAVELNGETQTVSLTSTAGDTFTPTSPKNGITSITVTPTNENRSVTPSANQQVLSVNSGYSGNGIITVAGDANLVAGNIKDGVSIFNVQGTYTGGSSTLITKSITQNGTYNASSDNADGYSSVTVNVSSGGGSGTRDVPLTRISDVNGNEIGTWYMNFVDANGNEYKVICLDARYRIPSAQWCSDKNTVTNMPIYNSNYDSWWYDNAKETATQNTQLILDYCSAGGYISTACTYCRYNSFIINGVPYYGQFPNMREVFDMWRHRVQIEQMDISASDFPDTNFSSARTIWSSSQYRSNGGWCFFDSSFVNFALKTNDKFICPVLEIPLS